jgi:DNA-binding MarR family transcriptional regulator
VREPNPADARSKLVIPTNRGKQVVAIVQQLVPTIEERIEELVGPRRTTALRADLTTIIQTYSHENQP